MLRYPALIWMGGSDRYQIRFPDLHQTEPDFPAAFEGYPPLCGVDMLAEDGSLVEPLFAATQFLVEQHRIFIRDGQQMPPPSEFGNALPPPGCALVAVPLIQFTPIPAILRSGIDTYSIEFLDLPDIVATGASIEEVLINAERAARKFATRAKRNGESLPTPSTLDSVDVPADTHLVIVPLYHDDT